MKRILSLSLVALLAACSPRNEEDRSSADPATNTEGRAHPAQARASDPGTPGQGTDGQGAASGPAEPTALERARRDSLRAAGREPRAEEEVTETEALARCRTLAPSEREECMRRVEEGFERSRSQATNGNRSE